MWERQGKEASQKSSKCNYPLLTRSMSLTPSLCLCFCCLQPHFSSPRHVPSNCNHCSPFPNIPSPSQISLSPPYSLLFHFPALPRGHRSESLLLRAVGGKDGRILLGSTDEADWSPDRRQTQRDEVKGGFEAEIKLN